jgi:hypothetical protein
MVTFPHERNVEEDRQTDRQAGMLQAIVLQSYRVEDEWAVWTEKKAHLSQ